MIKNTPLISIIVPVYNVEKYLAQCLNSLLNQTYSNIEIICINDGSTDSSLNILNHYKDQNLQIKVFTTSNEGQAAARNLGLKEASGEFVMFVDSDDWLDCDAVEAILKEDFFSDINVSFACFGLNQVTDDSIVEYHSYSSNAVCPVSEKQALKIYPGPVAKLYRTSFLRGNNIFFPEGLWYEDITFFWICISHAKKIAISKKNFYNYRKRCDSTMGQSNNRASGMAIHFLYNLESIHNSWTKNNYLSNHQKLYEYLFELYTQEGYKFLHPNDLKSYTSQLKLLTEKINLQPKRYSLVFDLIHNRRVNHFRNRWARSLRKKFLN